MYRRFITLALLILVSSENAIATETETTSENKDSQNIYTSFIDSWTGKKKDPINISIKAIAPTDDELKDFSECASNSHWAPIVPINNLTDLIGNLSYVHLVDSSSWSPTDPEILIAKGMSADTAVEEGFKNGLGTFSAIAFNNSHTLAAFSFSFVCGSLCGNGRTVLFKRTSKGWVQVKKQCGGWVS